MLRPFDLSRTTTLEFYRRARARAPSYEETSSRHDIGEFGDAACEIRSDNNRESRYFRLALMVIT